MVHAIEQIGAFAGLAAFLGLAVLALLSFTHGRDIRRLREWAGSAPERDAERKEQTSTIAAQRAEELRALEEARTAEHDAVSNREERRRRREEGVPEQSRGERMRGWFSGFGERASRPSSLVALFIVILAIVGGAAYLVSKAIKKSRVLGFADLGMEAIYEFDVVDMPVTVAVDAAGTSVHNTGPAEWKAKIEQLNVPVVAA